MGMMMEFAMTRFTKSNTVFQIVSKLHREKTTDRYNMMDFKTFCVAAYLAFLFVFFDACCLNFIPHPMRRG